VVVADTSHSARSDGSDTGAVLRVIHEAKETGDWALALNALSALQTASCSDVGLRQIAIELVTQRQFDPALPIVAAVTARPSANPDDFRRHARCLTSGSRHDEALQILESGLARCSDHLALRIDRALALSQAGQAEAARRELIVILKQKPTHAPVMLALFQAARQAGDDADALHWAKGLLALTPDDTSAIRRCAEAERNAGHFQAALDRTAAALREHPQHVDLTVSLAQLLRVLGRAAEAIIALQALDRPGHRDVGKLLAILAADLQRKPAPMPTKKHVQNVTTRWRSQGDSSRAARELQLHWMNSVADPAVRADILRALMALARVDLIAINLAELVADETQQDTQLLRTAVEIGREFALHQTAMELGRRLMLEPAIRDLAALECAEVALCAGRVADAKKLLGSKHDLSQQLAFWRSWFKARLAEQQGSPASARLRYLDALGKDFKNALVHERLALLNLAQLRLPEAKAAWQKSLARKLGSDQAMMIRSRQGLFGHILNDYLIDAAEIEAARTGKPRDIMQDPERPRLWKAMEILRRAGVFTQAPSRRVPASSTDAPEIPDIIHLFCLDREIDAETRARLAAWRRTNPLSDVRLLDNAAMGQLLRQHFRDDLITHIDMLADAGLRRGLKVLMVLFAEGGFVCQSGVTALAPLRQVVGPQSTLVISEGYFSAPSLEFIGCTARHPVIVHALRNGLHAAMSQASCNAWIEVGPGALAMALSVWLAKHEDDGVFAVPEELVALSQGQTARLMQAGARAWLRRA
jgi:tetratricopeptide (TPR) repeat protein